MTLFIRPRDNRFLSSFSFKYAVTGDEYVWIEKFVIGPDGMTYFIVGVSIASFMALLILIAIICCIVSCCRKHKKVNSVDSDNSRHNSVDITPDSAMRLPGNGMTRDDLTRNAADVSLNIPYGHSNSANPNDLTMLTNGGGHQPKQPVIKKYNKDELSDPRH